MAIYSAREIKDRDIVLVGVGLPNLAANFAKRVYSPNLTLVYESGSIDCFPRRQPLSIGDSSLSENVVALYPIFEMFSYIISGERIDVGYLGAAQVDAKGKLNTTVIGDYNSPKVRLPGSGGACEIMSSAKKSVVMTEFTDEKLRERVDYITSSLAMGNQGDNGHSHDEVIVTDRCIIKLNRYREAEISYIYEGVDVDEIRKLAGKIGISCPEEIQVLEDPKEEEVRILREMDPMRTYLK